MDEHNPYRAPNAQIVDSAMAPDPSLPLAGRGERLIASILDTILLLVLVLPVMFFTGYFDFVETEGGLMETIAIEVAVTLVMFALFALIQAYPLYKSGQTWGKVALSIRIVDMEGRKPDFWRMLALRYLPLHVVSSIPGVGSLAAMIDSLMIFRQDRRCAHDLIAGTRVVAVERKSAV
jgi:uncharacterized RDD family membrane protein YckC